MDVCMKTYSAYPPVFSTSRAAEGLNEGGKILLPQTLLGEIANMKLTFPLQFRIQTRHKRECYCGVHEFTSDEGKVILPQWMFAHLLIEPGEMIRLSTVTLPKGDIVKLRPQKKAFIELSNPKAVLEKALQKHTTLTLGTSIVVNYENVDYDLDIIEMKGVGFPKANAIMIIDCNLKVDFERPLDMPPSPVRAAPPADFGANNVIGGGGASIGVGASSSSLNFAPVAFKPPSLTGGKKKPKADAEEKPSFSPFLGTARTLSGRPAQPLSDTVTSNASSSSAGQPLGTQLASTTSTVNGTPTNGADAAFVPFAGKGRTLKGN